MRERHRLHAQLLTVTMQRVIFRSFIVIKSSLKFAEKFLDLKSLHIDQVNQVN